MLEEVVDHHIDKVGNIMYYTKWLGCPEEQNTLEQTANLRRSMIQGYFRRKEKPDPQDLDVAIEG